MLVLSWICLALGESRPQLQRMIFQFLFWFSILIWVNISGATLRAKKVPSSMVPDRTLFFWLMPHKVAVWIYWHALQLWWKNVPFIQHPRYANPGYREEASLRDQKLNCCKASSMGVTSSCPGDDASGGTHQFTWTDAKWPWS